MARKIVGKEARLGREGPVWRDASEDREVGFDDPPLTRFGVRSTHQHQVPTLPVLSVFAGFDVPAVHYMTLVQHAHPSRHFGILVKLAGREEVDSDGPRTETVCHALRGRHLSEQGLWRLGRIGTCARAPESAVKGSAPRQRHPRDRLPVYIPGFGGSVCWFERGASIRHSMAPRRLTEMVAGVACWWNCFSMKCSDCGKGVPWGADRYISCVTERPAGRPAPEPPDPDFGSTASGMSWPLGRPPTAAAAGNGRSDSVDARDPKT